MNEQKNLRVPRLLECINPLLMNYQRNNYSMLKWITHRWSESFMNCWIIDEANRSPTTKTIWKNRLSTTKLLSKNRLWMMDLPTKWIFREQWVIFKKIIRQRLNHFKRIICKNDEIILEKLFANGRLINKVNRLRTTESS